MLLIIILKNNYSSLLNFYNILYDIYLILARRLVRFIEWALSGPPKPHAFVESSLQSGISIDSLIMIFKFLKKRFFFMDIIFSFLVATYSKNLIIKIFGLNLTYYIDYIISGTIFIIITYIVGWIMIELKVSNNIKKKKLYSYIFYRYFNLTIFYFVNPIFSVFILYLLHSNEELFYHILPNDTEISENLYPTEPIDGINLGRLAENADALSICDSSLTTCQDYIQTLTNVFNGIKDINDPETLNEIRNHRTELYGILREGQIHLSDNSIRSNILGTKTKIRVLSDIIGPRGKDYVVNDIRLLHTQLQSLNEFKDIFTAEFETVTKEVASDFKSKLKLNENIPESDLINVIKRNTIKYRDTSTKNIANNIAKELGYEKISNIKF